MLSRRLRAANKKPILIYRQTNTFSATASSFTVSNADVGQASFDRLVIVCVAGVDGSGSSSISSCTIGGSTATNISGTGLSRSGHAAIFALNLSIGSTATIVVQFGVSAARDIGISVYTAYNLSSYTPLYVGSQSATATSRTINATTEFNAIAIVSSSTGSAASATTFNGVTADYSTRLRTATVVSAASATDIAVNPLVITVTSNAPTLLTTAVATWR